MRKIVTFLTFALITHSINGQSLTASYLRIFAKTTAVVPIINEGKGPDGTDNSFSFSYEHFIKKQRYSIAASYTQFNGCTLIYFEEGGWVGRDGNPIDGYGFCNGIKIHRFDIGASCNVMKNKRKFYLKPCIWVGLQKSSLTGVSFWDDAEPVNGPNYFELEPMSAEPMNTTQIVPSLGFRTGFVFWKRLDVGLSFQGVYAFKPYQKLSLKYQYKGLVQPMAEYESTGTGLFVSLGVGYRFAKWIK